jgi:hypothetical protein
MKVTKKYLQRVIEEETMKLLEFEYPNTRAQHKKKDAIAAYFREALDGNLDSDTDEFWPEAFEEVSIDGDESGSAPDAFTITLKPHILTPEEAAGLVQSLKRSKFMGVLKEIFTEESRMAMSGSLKARLYDRFDAFVLEGSELNDIDGLQFRFKWSKKVAGAQGLESTIVTNDLSNDLRDVQASHTQVNAAR